MGLTTRQRIRTQGALNLEKAKKNPNKKLIALAKKNLKKK